MAEEVNVELSADVTMAAVVVRCGCADVQTGYERHGKLGQPCPNPKSVEDRGEIAREHFEGADARAEYERWCQATGQTIPHVERKLKGGKR